MAWSPCTRRQYTFSTAVLLRFIAMLGGTVPSGERMIIKDGIGNEYDVFIFTQGNNVKIKRVAMHVGIQMPSSPTSSSSFTGGHSFVDLPADEEQRLLAIYKRFGKQ